MDPKPKTFTKAELVRACGDFYELVNDLWQRRVEQWTEAEVLRTVDDPHSTSGKHRRYSEEEVYISLLLFRLKAIGFSLPTIRAVSRVLHTTWDIDLDKRPHNDLDLTREVVTNVRDYWNAAKDDTWNEERWNGPPTLTVILVPDSGRGFEADESEVFVQMGANPKIPPGCESISLNLQKIFAAARTRPKRTIISRPGGPQQVITIAG